MSRSMPYKKSARELRTAFEEQLAALEASCEGFDSGSLWEARRIAAVVYILLHDGGRNARSLAWQLGLKAGLVMLSCRQGWSDTSLASQMPLVAIKMTSTGASYHPLLDNCPIPPDRLKFSKWWEQPVLRDSEHRTISRKNLIFSLRNQDGGAHVDGELSDHAYTAISRENGAGWLFGRPGGPGTPLDPGPHLATMRQIGWEVQQSLTPVDEEN